MNQNLLERFSKLFSGRTSAYGIWSDEHGAKTVHRPVTQRLYQDHLDGKVGLGIIPIQDDGTCVFAAVDIDVYDLNHLNLAKRIEEKKIPLVVCKTKSGGAHLFAFYKEPVQAATARGQLKTWATILGYSRVEIFPKQVKVGPDNAGSWINLPYFNLTKTVRYAVDAENPLGLEEFFQRVDNLLSPIPVLNELGTGEDLSEYPPCLRALYTQGLPEGSRNAGLFNFGVYFKKSDPQGWETRLMEHNLRFVQPSLPYKELQTIVRSLNKTTYQYTCDQEPICSHCDYDPCSKLKYGVTNLPGKASSDAIYHPVTIAHCRKLNTDPPFFMIEVNGKDISLSSEEFLIYRSFRLRLMELMNLVVKPITQVDWEKQVKDLLDKREEIGAPIDASVTGQILNRVTEFLELVEKTRHTTDLWRDLPVKMGNYIVFKGVALKKYLAMHKLDRITDQKIYMILKDHGCVFKRVNVEGKAILVWAIKYDEFFQTTQRDDDPELLIS